MIAGTEGKETITVKQLELLRLVELPHILSLILPSRLRTLHEKRIYFILYKLRINKNYFTNFKKGE